ncbi:MAG: nuclease [Chrysothrix sp. TS-e1954]|nr:MAG: nuclease [Chrysothrix sp. TS-e1954]
MPLDNLIFGAITGAAAGAAATSLYFTAKRQQETTPTPTATPTTNPPPSATAPTLPHTSILKPPTLTQPPVDPSGIYAYGFPGPISDLKPTPSLLSSFNRSTRNPHWVAEHITPASLALRNGDRRHSYFAEDSQIPEAFRARLSDYHASGYDRGHQVPAADAKWSQSAMDSTFYLSNMCPQVGDGFNRDYWAHFEDFCRRLTVRYPSVRIVTGPLYLPRREADGKWRVSYEVIGSPPNVSVPTHFYKVVYGEDAGRPGAGSVALAAFVLPNAPIRNERSLKEFEVPLELVERASGLVFAGKLPRERRRKLCAEVDCSVVVKEYADRQKAFAKGEVKAR